MEVKHLNLYDIPNTAAKLSLVKSQKEKTQVMLFLGVVNLR